MTRRADGAFWVGITPRKRKRAKSGKVFQVVFRLGGGRYTDPIYLCTCPTREVAEQRRKFAYLELAAGRDPRATLAALASAIHEQKTHGLRATWDTYLAQKKDVGLSTAKNHRAAQDKVCSILGDNVDPKSITVPMVVNVILRLPETMTSVDAMRQYIGKLAILLDWLDVTPNPARSPKLKAAYPRKRKQELLVPNLDEFLLILSEVKHEDDRLALRLTEALGLRMEELEGLKVGDLDFAEQMIRVFWTKLGTNGERWLPVPDELWDEIVKLVPATLQERKVARGRRVFLRLRDGKLREMVGGICTRLGIQRYSPHKLRHRRVSLWLRHGFDPVQVREWAGHSSSEMSIDTYGHVIVSKDDEWRDFWIDQYTKVRARKSPFLDVIDPLDV